MKYSRKELRNIAMALGNPVGYIGLPYVLSSVTVGLLLKKLNDGVLSIPLWIIASLLLTFCAVPFYTAFTGKRILRAIEKDYGPRTSRQVYDTFAEAKAGEPISLNIPELAKAFGENK